MNIRNRLPILMAAVLILVFSIEVLAQNITGTIVGTVKDGSGARREMEQVAEAARKIQTYAGELAAKAKET
jgi:hypothetical protein